VNGQLHTPTALISGEQTIVPTGHGACWTKDWSSHDGKKKISALAGNLMSVLQPSAGNFTGKTSRFIHSLNTVQTTYTVNQKL
jgi:hypothetical protein